MATNRESRTLMELRRKELGLSQEAVAKAVGVAKNSYIEWEKGRSIPRGQNLLKLAKVLKIEAVQLAPEPEQVVEREERYPSFQQFLDAGLHEGLTDEQLARVRGDGHYGGDPGVRYYVLRAEAERAASQHMSAAKNLADPSRQPDGIPLKKKS